MAEETKRADSLFTTIRADLWVGGECDGVFGANVDARGDQLEECLERGGTVSSWFSWLCLRARLVV